jgi:acyl-CoA thioesterase
MNDDRAFLGLDLADGERVGRFTVADHFLAPHGRFYGGAGIAVAAAAMEAASGRRLVWATTQFVGTAFPGETVDVAVDVLAAGRAVSQSRVEATVGDRTLFVALGATGVERDDMPAGALHTRPDVPAPDACPPGRLPLPRGGHIGHLAACELRDATGGDTSALRYWSRVPGWSATSPAMLGYLADYVPLAVMLALGVPGAGTSLDNTLRLGAEVDGDWVLIDGRGDLAARGYGHGSILLWSESGALLAVATQTAMLRRFAG